MSFVLSLFVCLSVCVVGSFSPQVPGFEAAGASDGTQDSWYPKPAISPDYTSGGSHSSGGGGSGITGVSSRS